MESNVINMIQNQRDMSVSEALIPLCVGFGVEEHQPEGHCLQHEEQREAIGEGGKEEELQTVGYNHMRLPCSAHSSRSYDPQKMLQRMNQENDWIMDFLTLPI